MQRKNIRGRRPDVNFDCLSARRSNASQVHIQCLVRTKLFLLSDDSLINLIFASRGTGFLRMQHYYISLLPPRKIKGAFRPKSQLCLSSLNGNFFSKAEVQCLGLMFTPLLISIRYHKYSQYHSLKASSISAWINS